jgi:hypothetical protein
MSNETTPNPFDFPTRTEAGHPIIADAVLDELQAQLKSIKEEDAAAVLRTIEIEIQKKKTASEILGVVTGILGAAVKAFK